VWGALVFQLLQTRAEAVPERSTVLVTAGSFLAVPHDVAKPVDE
jgi:hypothetical protein